MGLSLNLSRLIEAPCSAVLEACIEPGQLARWWGPRGFAVPAVELEPTPGGVYRIAMQPPDGELFHLSGEYLEVDPPQALAYSFRWEPADPDDRVTVVRMTLLERGASTEVVVDQSEFATEERRALHVDGWTDSLERLEELMSSRGAD